MIGVPVHGVDSHAVESTEHIVKQLKMMEIFFIILFYFHVEGQHKNINLHPSKQLAAINDEWKTF